MTQQKFIPFLVPPTYQVQELQQLSTIEEISQKTSWPSSIDWNRKRAIKNPQARDLQVFPSL